jgi:hypothetical protein
MPRGKAYQQAVERVRELLVRLAPEVFQDLGQPWLATMKDIEATGIIERLEECAAPTRHAMEKDVVLARRYRPKT